MKTENNFPDSICPLCGDGNRCAISAGQKAQQCWCKSVTFDSKTLEDIPSQLQGRVCICETCATRGGKNHER